MVLLRVIVLHGLRHNIRIQAKHVPGISNQNQRQPQQAEIKPIQEPDGKQ